MSYKTALYFNESELREILRAVSTARVGLIGDVCLDVYWQADMRRSELSRETPHFPLPVVEERMSLGGGGNVAANVAALGASVAVISIVGQDWRGNEIARLCAQSGIDSSRIRAVPGMATNAYCKPLRAGISDTVYEDPRLDFANYASPGERTQDELIERLQGLEREIDVLCVCDQMPYGVVTPKVRRAILDVAARGLTVVVDSRDRVGLYQSCRNVIVKPNEVEAFKTCGLELHKSNEEFCKDESYLVQYSQCATQLATRNGVEVCMTTGPRGAFYSNGADTAHIRAHDISGPLDICGAGDSFLSAFAAACASGASRTHAVAFGVLASEVTIQKIGVTGTASPREIVDLYRAVQ